MLLGGTDITFCPAEECNNTDCRRHYIHTKDIPQGTPYSIFADKPREEQGSCPYYWKWYTKEAIEAVEKKGVNKYAKKGYKK